MANLEQYFQESAKIKIDFIQNNEQKLQKIIDIIDHAIKN
jgi:hypothetical protein